jgi:hypothetical protein
VNDATIVDEGVVRGSTACTEHPSAAQCTSEGEEGKKTKWEEKAGKEDHSTFQRLPALQSKRKSTDRVRERTCNSPTSPCPHSPVSNARSDWPAANERVRGTVRETVGTSEGRMGRVSVRGELLHLAVGGRGGNGESGCHDRLAGRCEIGSGGGRWSWSECGER